MKTNFMSADCYLIGIGGSGSKCIDNYTYICASGLGPDDLWMGIVDQDQPNGNVAKAKKILQIIKTYIKNLEVRGKIIFYQILIYLKQI